MNALSKEISNWANTVEKNLYPEVSKDKYRLGFHIMPPVGWLNDPNGLCQIDGVYHVFFQYAPFNANGALKLWGHYVSRDMINWEYKGIPLVPDEPFDCHGVYSGSAYVENGLMHIFYTGNVKLEGDYDYITTGRGAATVHTICEDGIHIKNKKCVLKNEDYPKNYSLHIRDPKVWKEAKDNNYYMILGGRTLENEGRALIYNSPDLEKWQLKNELKLDRKDNTEEKFGYMWECPDLFKINDRTLLSVSPQGLQRGKLQFQNVYQSGYFTLEGDYRESYELKNFKEWDMGFDFYAPQTFEDEKGRRLLVGWIGMPDSEKEYTNKPTVENGWQHALTMFREIVVSKDDKVLQKPLKEYETLRLEKTESTDTIYEALNLSSYEIILEDIGCDDFQIIIADGLLLTYENSNAIFKIEFINDIGAGRKIRNAQVSECKTVQIFVDTSVIEIYINDGETVFTSRYYPKNNSLKIKAPDTKKTIWTLSALNMQMDL